MGKAFLYRPVLLRGLHGTYQGQHLRHSPPYRRFSPSIRVDYLVRLDHDLHGQCHLHHCHSQRLPPGYNPLGGVGGHLQPQAEQ